MSINSLLPTPKVGNFSSLRQFLFAFHTQLTITNSDQLHTFLSLSLSEGIFMAPSILSL